MLERMNRMIQISNSEYRMEDEDGKLFQGIEGNAIELTSERGSQEIRALRIVPGADGEHSATYHRISERSSAENLLRRFKAGQMPQVAASRRLRQPPPAFPRGAHFYPQVAALPPLQYDPSATGMQFVDHAANNMRDGTLVKTGSSRIWHKLMHYDAFYNPTQPKILSQSSFSDFIPGPQNIIIPTIEYFMQQYVEGASIKPIRVAPTHDGQLVVLDGHHRLAAGMRLGRQIPLLITLDPVTPFARNWEGVIAQAAPDQEPTAGIPVEEMGSDYTKSTLSEQSEHSSEMS